MIRSNISLTLLIYFLDLEAGLYSLLPLSPNKSIPRIRASQTFLSLTIFIEKTNNIYDIKLAHYENVFYGKSNYTSCIS